MWCVNNNAIEERRESYGRCECVRQEGGEVSYVMAVPRSSNCFGAKPPVSSDALTRNLQASSHGHVL